MGAQRPAGWVPSLIPSINTMLSLAFENHDLVWTHGDRDGTAGNAIFFYWVVFFFCIFWMVKMSLLRDFSFLV